VELSYILNHLGEERSTYRNAVAPPIFQSSIFAFSSVEEMRKGIADELNTNLYTRGNNPTVDILRKKIAALEGAQDCLMFSSGAAAISAAVMASVKQGDEVVCVSKPYSWTRSLLRDLLPRFGVNTQFVGATNTANVEAALSERTRLIVLESPNSLTFEQQDLSAVATLARTRNIRTLCDNSYASPLNQSPIALGIDMVAHSATKYLNGHSDVVAGAICSSKEIIESVFRGPYMTFGAILSPHDAWLMIRGLRTLPIRMQRIAETTIQIIAYLENHPRISKIYYPHYKTNTQILLSQQQLHGVSGLFSVELYVDDVASVERFCNSLQHFLMTVSWGGYESLIFPVCVAHSSSAPLRPAQGLPLNLVRFSIGLEDADFLIADLEQALTKI